MQTLYGIKVTDRVEVIKANGQYLAYFDKVHVGTYPSGVLAVKGAKEAIDRLRGEREAEEAERRADEKRRYEEFEREEFNRSVSKIRDRLMTALNVPSEVIDDIQALIILLASKLGKGDE